MTGGTEVAGFAGEGEEVLVAATGAEESGEAGGEVAAAEEVFDVSDGCRDARGPWRDGGPFRSQR